jgi:hypothetical protein
VVTLIASTVAGAGCTHGHADSRPWANPVAPQGAVVTVAAAPGALNVDPVVPVRVAAVGGTLVSVLMVNDAGKLVDGVVKPERSLWKNTEPLGYGKTYTVTVASRSATGVTATISR